MNIGAIRRFHTPTQLIFGEGVAAQIGERVAERGCRHVLLVTDQGVEAAGIADQIRGHLAGVKVTTFNEVVANPTEDNVQAGSACLLANKCDVVVALGGGSPMDAAKAIAMLATHGGNIVDYEYGKQPIVRPGVPVISIPTTAGTGSEATFWSVITDQRRHRKFDVGSPFMAAAVALVDPELTYSLPASVTAATGMDALCHAVEAFTTKNAGPVTDALALRAIELLAPNLIAAYRNGADKEARRAVMLGSMTAGMAFPNAGLGAVHGLTAPLGGHFGVPHGVANAILLPVVMEFNRPVCPERFAQIGAALGGSDPVTWVRKLNAAMKIPRLASFGIAEKDLPRLAADALGPNSNCNSNPRPVTLADAEQLLREAL